MTLERTARGTVEAVVVDNGRLLLVGAAEAWGLPAGTPEAAETPEATAARAVYELTGYLVDGSSLLRPTEETPAPAVPVVVCRLLSDSPSSEATLPAERVRWVPLAEAADAEVPPLVREFLRGRTTL
ncbi:NUDIX domain-containing protein [Streptomyces sp. NPDC086091]|uniref:NUDIX domain-containing protein n=1 Tax=unclassified Streptomyces TaxID=2593676 RepID=UPI00382A0C5B